MSSRRALLLADVVHLTVGTYTCALKLARSPYRAAVVFHARAPVSKPCCHGYGADQPNCRGTLRRRAHPRSGLFCLREAGLQGGWGPGNLQGHNRERHCIHGVGPARVVWADLSLVGSHPTISKQHRRLLQHSSLCSTVACCMLHVMLQQLARLCAVRSWRSFDVHLNPFICAQPHVLH